MTTCHSAPTRRPVRETPTSTESGVPAADWPVTPASTARAAGIAAVPAGALAVRATNGRVERRHLMRLDPTRTVPVTAEPANRPASETVISPRRVRCSDPAARKLPSAATMPRTRATSSRNGVFPHVMPSPTRPSTRLSDVRTSEIAVEPMLRGSIDPPP